MESVHSTRQVVGCGQQKWIFTLFIELSGFGVGGDLYEFRWRDKHCWASVQQFTSGRCVIKCATQTKGKNMFVQVNRMRCMTHFSHKIHRYLLDQVCHFKKGTEICNYSYSNTILGVKLNRARLVVCLEESLYIHNIRDMKVVHTIRDTPPNRRGLCALASDSDHCYLAYPGSPTFDTAPKFE